MNNELYHYGVLGMKWGVRKADKLGVKFDNRSIGTKLATKLAKSSTTAYSKANYTRNAGISKLRDDRMLDYAKKTSAGAAIARRALMGWASVMAYEESRAVGYSKGKSFALSVIPVIGLYKATMKNAQDYDAMKKK